MVFKMTEPTFSDEDLKRLRTFIQYDEGAYLRKAVQALLARLEAAEEVTSYFANHPDSAYWWPYAQNALEAWRQTAGKKGE